MRVIVFIAAMLCSSAVNAQEAATASGGELRVLDKLTGAVTDMSLQSGETQRLGFLSVTLKQCRYPSTNPSGDAYVEIYVTYRDDPNPLFNGWMLASSPALEAMDHPRYDIWALRCITS
ncbi:MAG: DUF2155 domain-containing protein [Pseudomonadota bacterium]